MTTNPDRRVLELLKAVQVNFRTGNGTMEQTIDRMLAALPADESTDRGEGRGEIDRDAESRNVALEEVAAWASMRAVQHKAIVPACIYDDARAYWNGSSDAFREMADHARSLKSPAAPGGEKTTAKLQGGPSEVPASGANADPLVPDPATASRDAGVQHSAPTPCAECGHGKREHPRVVNGVQYGKKTAYGSDWMCLADGCRCTSYKEKAGDDNERAGRDAAGFQPSPRHPEAAKAAQEKVSGTPDQSPPAPPAPLACPFCGTCDSEEFATMREDGLPHRPWQGVCSCGARGPHTDHSYDAIAAWNRRAAPTVAQVVEAVRKCYRGFGNGETNEYVEAAIRALYAKEPQ